MHRLLPIGPIDIIRTKPRGNRCEKAARHKLSKPGLPWLSDTVEPGASASSIEVDPSLTVHLPEGMVEETATVQMRRLDNDMDAESIADFGSPDASILPFDYYRIRVTDVNGEIIASDAGEFWSTNHQARLTHDIVGVEIAAERRTWLGAKINYTINNGGNIIANCSDWDGDAPDLFGKKTFVGSTLEGKFFNAEPDQLEHSAICQNDFYLYCIGNQ